MSRDQGGSRSASVNTDHVELCDVHRFGVLAAAWGATLDTMRKDVSDPYTHIEQWWGEPLSQELVERIVGAPKTHIQKFLSEPFLCSENNDWPLTSPGKLRPLVTCTSYDDLERKSKYRYLEAAINLALYAHEVLIEDPLYLLTSKDYSEVRFVLSRLLDLKNLTEQGTVRFARFDSRSRHPAYAHTFTDHKEDHKEEWLSQPEFQDLLRSMTELAERDRDYDFATLVFFLRSEIGAKLRVVSRNPGSFNQLIRSDEELILYRIAMIRASKVLFDERDIRLRSLANLEIPRLLARPRSLVELRKSSAEFAEWRSALSVALNEIDTLGSSDEQWNKHASEIIYEALEPIRSRVEASSRKSPFLSSITEGLTSLTFSGIGSIVGSAVGGNIASGVTGAAAAKAAEIGVAYLMAIGDRRHDRAILDLILTFNL